MSGVILSFAARQSAEVQRRAIAAVQLQRRRAIEPRSLSRLLGEKPSETAKPATLDAWYRAQPIEPGRISPRLALTDAEKRAYGLPPSARLVELGSLGDDCSEWAVYLIPVMGGFVVGVKAPDGGGGVGVLWKRSHKASDYALRLSVEHGMPIRERYA